MRYYDPSFEYITSPKQPEVHNLYSIVVRGGPSYTAISDMPGENFVDFGLWLLKHTGGERTDGHTDTLIAIFRTRQMATN